MKIQESDLLIITVNLLGYSATNTETRITLEAFSDQPGVQLYTGNFFPDPEKEETPIPGKENREYAKHGAFCLETQNFPNAINVVSYPRLT